MVNIAVVGICGHSVCMTADHFHEKGETVVATSVHEEMGGKGSNQAIAASRMGAAVRFLAAVGDDDAGEMCRRTLAACGVEATLAVKPGGRTPFAYILTDKHGENRVTEYKSAELTPADVDGFEPAIAGADILLLQHEVPPAVNARAVALAQKHGVRVILNPAPYRPVSPAVAAGVDTVTPNEQEAKGLTGMVFPHTVVTLGGEGCLIDGAHRVPALPVTAVDTTGAGDTFNGILAVCLAEGMPLTEACRWAVTGASISVSRRYVLDAIPTRNEIEKILEEA
ncbi:MAG: ribokinase [Ruminococcaceae bacterium]|nr:ribokinase [Oscillospiraceae bacterium]